MIENAPESAFERFWQAYPRKVGKGLARKVFVALKPTCELQERILRAIKEQSSSQQWQKNNGEFIPHPATWLRQERWEDAPDTQSAAPEPNWAPSRPVVKEGPMTYPEYLKIARELRQKAAQAKHTNWATYLEVLADFYECNGDRVQAGEKPHWPPPTIRGFFGAVLAGAVRHSATALLALMLAQPALATPTPTATFVPSHSPTPTGTFEPMEPVVIKCFRSDSLLGVYCCGRVTEKTWGNMRLREEWEPIDCVGMPR